MRTRLPAVAVLGVLAAAVAGCGEDEGTNPLLDPLLGSWRATKFVVSSALLPPPGSIDVITLGWSLTVRIEADGSYEMTISVPGEPTETERGKVTVTESQVTITPDDPSEPAITFTYTVGQGMLTLDGKLAMDVNEDGTDDIVDVHLELTRI